jgi:CubicO group peptidase (beta-lactamase class C family)
LILVDRGLLDLDEPVARYWPAFGQNGKEDIPVRLVLSHRSGVAALDAPISNDQAAALDPVLRLIEQQRPWWRPGTKHGYHAMTYGFILSGLVRAVTGRTVGQFFADEVAKPLNLDLHIGLPRDRHSTVAPMIGPSQRQAIRSMLNPVWFRYALVSPTGARHHIEPRSAERRLATTTPKSSPGTRSRMRLRAL